MDHPHHFTIHEHAGANVTKNVELTQPPKPEGELILQTSQICPNPGSQGPIPQENMDMEVRTHFVVEFLMEISLKAFYSKAETLMYTFTHPSLSNSPLVSLAVWMCESC